MKLRFLAPLAALFVIGQATAATYTNDFNGTDAVSKFTTETTNAQWLVSGGVYTNSYTATDTVSSASVAVSGVAGSNFQISTQFSFSSVVAPGSSVSTIGFGALGNSATFGGNFYLADYTYANQSGSSDAGRLRLLAIGDTSDFSANNGNAKDNATATMAIQLDTTYTLRLTGTYSGSTLNLALALFDINGVQIGTTATATDTSPLAGDIFGYRNRLAAAASGGATPTPSHTVNFDNFSIVPEPSSMMLGALGALAAIGIRRR